MVNSQRVTIWSPPKAVMSYKKAPKRDAKTSKLPLWVGCCILKQSMAAKHLSKKQAANKSSAHSLYIKLLLLHLSSAPLFLVAKHVKEVYQKTGTGRTAVHLPCLSSHLLQTWLICFLVFVTPNSSPNRLQAGLTGILTLNCR